MLTLALAAVALTAPAGPTAPAVAGARVDTSCDTARHAAEFTGQMAAVPGTVRMQMRFTLLARTAGGGQWSAVRTRGFGTWVTSSPGVRRYVYVKRLQGLLGGSSYRALVRFRWLSASGRIVGAARVSSRQCVQPDPRPDLRARSLVIEPGADAGSRRYVAQVMNIGRSAAPPFAVAFTAAGSPLGTVRVGALAPGAATTVTLDGPACTPGGQVLAEADPGAAVDEADETNDAADAACPGS